MTTDASRFLFYPVFPRILNNSWQVLPLRPQCFWAILLSQYRRRTGSGPCTRGRRLRPPKGDFVTKYLFQFARILAFCFLGEILYAVLPLPIPASVYGLILLLLALRLGIVKLEQVKEVPGAHGIFSMSPEDHLGLDQRARVMVKIENGTWKYIP